MDMEYLEHEMFDSLQEEGKYFVCRIKPVRLVDYIVYNVKYYVETDLHDLTTADKTDLGEAFYSPPNEAEH